MSFVSVRHKLCTKVCIYISFVEVYHDMGVKLVSGVDFECLHQHLSNRTRLEGRWLGRAKFGRTTAQNRPGYLRRLLHMVDPETWSRRGMASELVHRLVMQIEFGLVGAWLRSLMGHRSGAYAVGNPISLSLTTPSLKRTSPSCPSMRLTPQPFFG